MLRIEANDKGNALRYTPLFLMTGLILLRFPLLILVGCHFIGLSDDIVLAVYTNGTYLLSAALIIYERKRLPCFNIDLFSLILFIGIPLLSPFVDNIGKFLNINIYLNHSPFKIIVALLLSLGLVILKPKFEKKALAKAVLWLMITVLAGLLFSILFAYLQCRQLHIGLVLKTKYDLVLAITSLLQQIAFAGISEEPLFRGFIWGYLTDKGFKWHWIWIFQALLFTLGHLYYLSSGYLYSLFIIVPISGLLLGLIAYRSRSIGNSIICHGLLNSVSSLIAFSGWM